MLFKRAGAGSILKKFPVVVLVLFPCLLMVLLAVPSGETQRQANAATGELLICSSDYDGGYSNGSSNYASISQDGRYISFSSSATDLIENDTNSYSDVFLFDAVTNQKVRCSTDSTGAQADGGSTYSSVDSTGSKIVFMSTATNLVAGDTNGVADIFCKDLTTGVTIRCSTDSSGQESNGVCSDPKISGNGRYVVFASDATNLVTGDTNAKKDVFRKDLVTGEVTRCSQSAALGEGNDASETPVINADGGYVAFATSATNLVSGDVNGFKDIVRYDCSTGGLVCCSTDSAGAQGNGDSSGTPSISSDGSLVLFSSNASNLVTNDTNGGGDCFRKNLNTGAILLCSTDQAGVQRYFQSPTMSGNGRYIAFSAYYQFVPRSLTYQTVYRKDLETGEILNCTCTTTGEVRSQHAYHQGISEDGTYVALRWYYSSNYDIFRKMPLCETSYISSLSPASGAPGSEVDISGEKFGSVRGASKVLFNEKEAAGYVQWSDSHIKAIAPTGTSGDIRVTVVNELGTSNGVTFNIPLPRISGIEPKDDYWNGYGSCGDELTIQGYDFLPRGDNSRVWFGTVAATEIPSWSDTEIKVIVPPGLEPGDCELTVENDAGVSQPDDFAVCPAIVNVDKDYGIIGEVVTIEGTSFGSSRGESTVYFCSAVATEYLAWSNTRIVARIPYYDYDFEAEDMKLTVGVIPFGEYLGWVNTDFEVVPFITCFAEGYTGAGFQEYICLGNANPYPAEVTIFYLLPDNYYWDQKLTVPANARLTANVNAEVPDMEVSAYIVSNVEIAVERPIYFNYGGGWTGGHDTVASRWLSKNWFFAEGYTGPGFEEWICVLNLYDAPANLTFHFQTAEEGEVVRTASLAPGTRGSFKVNDLLGPNYSCSLWLESDVLLVAERSMYFDYTGTCDGHWEGGHCVMGLPGLCKEFYFAEGTTRTGFEQWLTIQNPDDSDINVTATYVMEGGQGDPVNKNYTVGAGQRLTVFVPGEVGMERDLSVKL